MDILGLISVPNWLLILLLLILTYYLYMTWQNGVFQKMGVPVPDYMRILGHIPKYNKEGVHNLDTEWLKKYGKVYGTFSGSYPLLVVADTDMLRQILVKDFNNFCDRRVIDGLNGEVEKGLTVLKGEHWKHVRNIMTPTFSTGKMKNMMPLILNASDSLIRNVNIKLKESEVLDMKRVFGGYTMDVIASTSFGIDVDSQSNPDDPFVKHASNVFKADFRTVVAIFMMFVPFMRFLMVKLGISFFNKESGRFFKDLVQQVMEERETNNKKEYSDFLQLMLDAKRENTDNEKNDDTKWDPSMKGLTTQEIVSQSILFFVAGYETTGTTLSFVAYNLALNPDIQQKVYDEVIEKLGSEDFAWFLSSEEMINLRKKSADLVFNPFTPIDQSGYFQIKDLSVPLRYSGKKPNYENVQELVYMEMCINESLRLYPPSVRFDRVCVKDTEVKGIKIPKGMPVSIPTYGIHHSPDIWRDPEEFIPERFSPEEKAKMDSLHFLPFGYGPRNCIGMRLAYIEAKVALADFVRNFTVSRCEKTAVPPNFQKIGLLLPDHIWLKVEPRN